MKIAIAAAVVLASLTALVFFTRDLTRLRLTSGPRPVVAARDVEYAAGRKLDVYAPEGARDASVVIFFHGGYWIEGGKDHHRLLTGLYGSIGRALASRGVCCVIPNYRLGEIAPILEDADSALRWTRENIAAHGGSPARIFLMGHSAGGHVAALLGSRGDVRGVIALSAIWDVEDMHAKQDADFNARVTRRVFGPDPGRWRRYSPIHGLRPESVPHLVVVGGRDFEYLIPQAERARDALGARHRYLRLEGYDHSDLVLRIGSRIDDFMGPLLEFLNR